VPSTFFGLEIGRRALTANQFALDVVGQNTANVGTPGYSRQVAAFDETEAYGAPGADSGKPAQLGTGVTIASVNRVRDQFIDQRLNVANANAGALNSLRDILGRVEGAYGEPSSTGIGSQLTSFFNSFSDLSASPESGAARSTVLNKAQSLVNAIHQVNADLSAIGPEISSRIAARVGDVNSLSVQIAALNKQIGESVASGDHPNDLLDKRTALVSQLSSLVDVQVIESRSSQTDQPTGQIQINVGGFSVVRDDKSNALPAEYTNVGPDAGLRTPDGQAIPLRGGEVSGLIQAASLVDGYQTGLDTLASNLISAVNTIHAGGAGLDNISGRAFFSGSTAADIDVEPAIASDPQAIAAAAAPLPPATVAPGNGDNARALAALTSKPAVGVFSLNQYYNTSVAGIGADSQRFQTQTDNQSKVVTQLQNQQASVSGVNLDEELTKLLQYQRAYQAAARIINVQDDVLNRIINGLGSGVAGA
jgi:flagellar hook-associated protein 1 FlgK